MELDPWWGVMNRSGYTIIELVFVVVIFGLLLTIAYTRLTPAFQHARVNRAATVLATDLRYAQMLAVRERRPMAVLALSSVKGYLIRERDTAIVHRERFLGPNSEFDLGSFSGSPTSVEVFPTGVATTSITFTLGLTGYQRQVRMTRAGQVRIIRVP